MRQANDSRDSHHRDRSVDAINGRMSRGESRRGRSHDSLHVTSVTASPPSYRQTYRDMGEEEAEYCYALPVKPKSLNGNDVIILDVIVCKSALVNCYIITNTTKYRVSYSEGAVLPSRAIGQFI